jgi:hypothetical protein
VLLLRGIDKKSPIKARECNMGSLKGFWGKEGHFNKNAAMRRDF